MFAVVFGPVKFPFGQACRTEQGKEKFAGPHTTGIGLGVGGGGGAGAGGGGGGGGGGGSATPIVRFTT